MSFIATRFFIRGIMFEQKRNEKREGTHRRSTFLPSTTPASLSYTQRPGSPVCRHIALEANAYNDMIRVETIICKLFLLKMSDKALLDSMAPSYSVCPACGAKDCCYGHHDSYDRWMITIICGVRKEYLVTIQRAVCKSCGAPHALLPDILIPYSQYSLRFILCVLKAYASREGTVLDVCRQFSISASTLYKWRDLFEKHANLWLGILDRISQISVKDIEKFENIDRLPSVFFLRYGFSFLQKHRTTRCRRDL